MEEKITKKKSKAEAVVQPVEETPVAIQDDGALSEELLSLVYDIILEFKKSGSSYKYSLDLADLIGLDGTFKVGANVTMKAFSTSLDMRRYKDRAHNISF